MMNIRKGVLPVSEASKALRLNTTALRFILFLTGHGTGHL